MTGAPKAKAGPRRIRLPQPHPGQKTVRNASRRFNWLSAGRRWRKTTLAMALSVEASVRPNFRAIWGAPTFDQVRVAWDETKRAAGTVAVFNQQQMSCTFPGGGQVLYRSMDNPDNARGHTADGIVIDEAGDVDEAAWYEVLRPMLIDTGGWLWAIGTPKGRNWFWREFVAAAGRDDSACWNAPTLGCRITSEGLIREPNPLENPDVPFAEVLQLYRTLPERTFRQEILAEFIENSGGVFRNVYEAVDAGRTASTPPEPDATYYGGVDLARVEDFTVITIVDANKRQVYHERFNQVSWERQIASILAASRLYNGADMVVDSTGVGDPIYERLTDAGCPASAYPFTNASKQHLIDGLAMGIEQGKVRLMDVEQQTNELLAYAYELTPSRNVRTGAPSGMHDDCVIALALACWGATQTHFIEVF